MELLHWLNNAAQRVAEFLRTPWFKIGNAEISLALVLGLALILLISWYGARAAERGMVSAG